MNSEPLRCPVSTCFGWISFVEDEDGGFWGCGECGELWRSRDDMNAAIDEIVSAYKYRKKCYRKKAGNWIPGDASKEPDDYEDLVAAEDDLTDGDAEDECEEDQLLCCPTWGCDGMVCWCEDGPCPGKNDSGWYCDTCECMWRTRKELDSAIARIVKRGAHRMKIYKQSGSAWSPIGDSPDWEKLVKKHER